MDSIQLLNQNNNSCSLTAFIESQEYLIINLQGIQTISDINQTIYMYMFLSYFLIANTTTIKTSFGIVQMEMGRVYIKPLKWQIGYK